MMRPLLRQHQLPQTAMILIHPTAETISPATDAPVTTRAATEATATKTVIAAETVGAAIGLAIAMEAAVARPTPSRRPAARLAVIGAADAVVVAVMTTVIAILGAVEEAVTATIIGEAAAVADAHAPDRPVAITTGLAMIDEIIVTGGTGEVVMMTTAAEEAGRLVRTDQSAKRRRPL